MLLRPFLNDATSCASYLFGCGTYAKLAVVDPHAELVDGYLANATALGAPIVARGTVEPPPYHGTSQATRGDRNGFGLFAASALSRFAVDCHWLQPRGSIKAPSFVAELGYIG